MFSVIRLCAILIHDFNSPRHRDRSSTTHATSDAQGAQCVAATRVAEHVCVIPGRVIKSACARSEIRLIHPRLSTQLVYQGLCLCARLCCLRGSAIPRLRGFAARRLGGSAARRLRGSAAPRLRGSAAPRGAARCGSVRRRGAARRGAVARPGDAAARRCGAAVQRGGASVRCGAAVRRGASAAPAAAAAAAPAPRATKKTKSKPTG